MGSGEIKHCSNCETYGPKLVQVRNCFRYECDACGHRGELGKSGDEAADLWNSEEREPQEAFE